MKKSDSKCISWDNIVELLTSCGGGISKTFCQHRDWPKGKAFLLIKCDKEITGVLHSAPDTGVLQALQRYVASVGEGEK